MQDFIEHDIRFQKQIIVPESNDTISHRFQEGRSFLLFHNLFKMLPTIDAPSP